MLTRRSMLGFLAVAVAGPAAAATDHPSVAYMKSAARDLLAAHRQGTTSAFLRAVQRYADIPDIASYALGSYSKKITSAQRPRYQKGIATYIARYFAFGSRDYTVAKYEIGEATVDSDKNVRISTRVFLMTGQSYDVSWQLTWKDGRYRIRDARVVVFSLTSGLRKDVTNFLDKRNGDMNQLIAALHG